MAEETDPHGHIKMSRKAYESDPFWLEPREFSRWEAWEDMIQTAAWKAHRRVVGATVVKVHRGQLLASERFLAERWNWSRAKVRRFLTLLVEMERVEVDTDHESAHAGALVTLYNYDRYQSVRPKKRPTRRPGRAQDEPKEKAGKEREVKKKNPSGSKKTPLPNDWSPNERHQEIATEEGRSLIREIETFRDHAKANGRTQIDWDAAFRNWLRSDYGKPERPSKSKEWKDPNKKSQREILAELDQLGAG